MKKAVSNVTQAIVGFGVMLALWCVGSYCYDYTFENFTLENNSIFDTLPTVIIFLMPVLLLIATVVGKKIQLKTLYFSSLIGVGLPVLSCFLFSLFSNDGNILSWIFAFTLGMFLSPFHSLAWRTFDGVWLYPLGISPDFCAGMLTVSVIVSVILFKIMKPRKEKN